MRQYLGVAGDEVGLLTCSRRMGRFGFTGNPSPESTEAAVVAVEHGLVPLGHKIESGQHRKMRRELLRRMGETEGCERVEAHRESTSTAAEYMDGGVDCR